MPSTTLHTSGRKVLDSDGNEIVFRGVNLPLLDDWDFPLRDKLADCETSGANCIRIQWYRNYPVAGRPDYSIYDLDAFLTRCRDDRILPIVGLWDLTNETDVGKLITDILPWWTDPDVVRVLNAHQNYLVINLANELGVYRWGDNETADLTAYRDTYIAAVTAVRTAGLLMPVMIDAPDGGSSLDAFTAVLDPGVPNTVGRQLIDADPEHNLLLSGHAYWAVVDRTGAVDDAVAADLPIVLGEIANRAPSDDGTDQCHYSIDGSGVVVAAPSGFQYQALLTKLLDLKVGWLAWSWAPDGCADRNMGDYTTGAFTGLTRYGDDVVNNPIYGLSATAVRI